MTLTREEAGKLFDDIYAELKQAWLRNYPNEPFEIDEYITPRAMVFIAGYVAGAESMEEEE